MTEQTHKPMVSVVMSIYNEPLQWLEPAVESILKQTYSSFEFIIVCDNPEYTEGITYIRKAAAEDCRIRFIINENNLGPTKSFNRAISYARGKYIARMDADDISLPERFERQVDYLETHPEISVCASDAHTMDENGKVTRKNRYKKKRNPALNIIANSIAHPSVMFRKSLMELRTPIYNEDFTYSQDYELWLFLLLNGHRFHTLESPLLLYRKSRRQISATKKRRQVELFKKAHRKLITDWLTRYGIIEYTDAGDLRIMLKKASKAYRNVRHEDQEYLLMIIYVLYFSLGTDSWAYRFKYLADRNMPALHIRFIYTFRLFVSRKTRRDRTGFN